MEKKHVTITKEFMEVSDALMEEMHTFRVNLDIVKKGNRCLNAAKRCRKALSNIRDIGKTWRKLSPKRYDD